MSIIKETMEINSHPNDIIEVNIKNNTGTHFWRPGVNQYEIKEDKIFVKELKKSALLIRYIEDEDQPFALYGIYEQYWRKKDHVFQIVNPDLYMDEVIHVRDILNSEFYKKLARTEIHQVWPFGYWGITDE